MKNRFPGFYKISDQDRQNIWGSGIFVFDTNVLLNLYRYSTSTKDDFLKAIYSLREQIYIPHRVAEEYLKNRLVVVDQQANQYKTFETAISEIVETLEKQKGHPFVSAEILKSVKDAVDAVKEEIRKNKTDMENRYKNDDIFEKLTEYFDGKLGDDFSSDEYQAFFPSAELRYKEKIPPGFADAKKASEDTSNEAKKRLYGDLIIWKQTINKALSDGKDVILITDDEKDDWWLRQSGKTISPRPELIAEFKRETGREVLIYSAGSFLNEYRKLNTSEIKEASVEEVRHAESSEKLELEDISNYRDNFAKRTVTTKRLRPYVFSNKYIERYSDDLTGKMNDEDYRNTLKIKFKGIEKEIEDNQNKISTLMDFLEESVFSEKYGEIRKEIESISEINSLLQKRKRDLMIYLHRMEQ